MASSTNGTRVIVFALGGSSSETSSAKHTISPAEDIIVGLASRTPALGARHRT